MDSSARKSASHAHPSGVTPPRRSLGGSVIQNSAQRQRYWQPPMSDAICSARPSAAASARRPIIRSRPGALRRPLDRAVAPLRPRARHSGRAATSTRSTERSNERRTPADPTARQSARNSESKRAAKAVDGALQRPRKHRTIDRPRERSPNTLMDTPIRHGLPVTDRAGCCAGGCAEQGGYPVGEKRHLL